MNGRRDGGAGGRGQNESVRVTQSRLADNLQVRRWIGPEYAECGSVPNGAVRELTEAREERAAEGAEGSGRKARLCTALR